MQQGESKGLYLIGLWQCIRYVAGAFDVFIPGSWIGS